MVKNGDRKVSVFFYWSKMVMCLGTFLLLLGYPHSNRTNLGQICLYKSFFIPVCHAVVYPFRSKCQNCCKDMYFNSLQQFHHHFWPISPIYWKSKHTQLWKEAISAKTQPHHLTKLSTFEMGDPLYPCWLWNTILKLGKRYSIKHLFHVYLAWK